MIRFESDYLEGAHPRILENMSKTNFEQTAGYGVDPHCERARALIRTACGAPEADVHFLVGGTQANKTIIASILRPHQGVISADSGHIAVHETGAVEATGHKVLTLPSPDGKVTAAAVEAMLDAHAQSPTAEHEVAPGLLYLSFPTEWGTIYSKAELTALYAVCRRHGIPLFIDGARLGYGLACKSCDLTLPELAALCDVFYIGGTKVGALFGEAVVFMNPALKKDFRYAIKQHGGMLAKGRLLGIQFETLFEDGLYFSISRHAIALSDQIMQAVQRLGYRFLYESDSNQLFVIFPNDKLAALQAKYCFSDFGAVDANHRAVRICTSWATEPANVTALLKDLEN